MLFCHDLYDYFIDNEFSTLNLLIKTLHHTGFHLTIVLIFVLFQLIFVAHAFYENKISNNSNKNMGSPERVLLTVSKYLKLFIIGQKYVFGILKNKNKKNEHHTSFEMYADFSKDSYFSYLFLSVIILL